MSTKRIIGLSIAVLLSAYSAYNAKYGFSGPEFMFSLLFYGLIALAFTGSKKKPAIDESPPGE